MTDDELAEAVAHVRDHDSDWSDCWIIEHVEWLVLEVARLRGEAKES